MEKSINYFSSAAWKSIGYNTIVWLVPGLVVFVIYLFLILISIAASDGSLLQIEARLPKGLLSFMAIALLASAAFGIICFFIYDVHDMESILFLAFFILITMGAGVVFLRKELKRLC